MPIAIGVVGVGQTYRLITTVFYRKCYGARGNFIDIHAVSEITRVRPLSNELHLVGSTLIAGRLEEQLQ